MCKSYTRNLPLHPTGGMVAVHDPEYFKLLEERDALRSERDAIIERLLCLSVSGHSIIDLDRRLADLVKGTRS